MHQRSTCFGIAIVFLLATAMSTMAQDARRPRKFPAGSATQPAPTPPDEQQVDTLKIDTNLVTVPVIVTDASGLYVADLRQDEFSVSENDVRQSIAFFATVNAPFQVILMLDTSASTGEKLRQMQQAALAFVEQLQTADRVKVISFDNEVRDLNEFTNNREQLRTAILKTRSGEGTKLYDAFELALNSVRPLRGRKAIVLFTDGVDYHSDQASFDGTLRGLDEEGVIVYPIRYDTRAQTERIAREQAGDTSVALPTIGVIRTPAPGTTAPTFPGSEEGSIPTNGRRSTGILGLPSPAEIMRRRRDPNDPRNGDPRSSDPNPPIRGPGDDPRPPDSSGRTPPGPFPDPRDPRNTPPRTVNQPRRSDDSIGLMLDGLYLTADSYLEKLATRSGGRLLKADTLGSLPDAFAKIAAELRTQYSLGYYPTNAAHDGQYRKVKVVISRKTVSARARPGYRAPAN
ncbi:MAG: von Willebrand factor type domain protein [Acidobacteria bacterium]|nr:von Willebrand factor type domain protein [Acidobacteriota bacterium]